MVLKQFKVFGYDTESKEAANDFLKGLAQDNRLSSLMFQDERIIIVYYGDENKNVL